MAKNYIDNLSEEVKKGYRQKADLGEYPSKLPYVYKRLNTKNIVIDEEPARFVQKAYELFSEGNISLEKLRQKLVDEGFIYKKDNPEIGKSLVLTCFTLHSLILFKKLAILFIHNHCKK